MPPRDLQERTRLFAIAVVKFCRTLAQEQMKPRRKARQLRQGGECRPFAEITARRAAAARARNSKRSSERYSKKPTNASTVLEAFRDIRIKERAA